MSDIQIYIEKIAKLEEELAMKNKAIKVLWYFNGVDDKPGRFVSDERLAEMCDRYTEESVYDPYLSWFGPAKTVVEGILLNDKPIFSEDW